MAYEQKDGDGVLFKETDKKTPTSPDYSGRAQLDGVPYRIVGWRKAGKNGRPDFLSLRIEPDDGSRGARKVDDDTIPF